MNRLVVHNGNLLFDRGDGGFLRQVERIPRDDVRLIDARHLEERVAHDPHADTLGRFRFRDHALAPFADQRLNIYHHTYTPSLQFIK